MFSFSQEILLVLINKMDAQIQYIIKSNQLPKI